MRNSIFNGFWNGNVTAIRVPSEEQLLGFLDTIGQNNLINRVTLDPCANGLSWSPEGDWLAYTMRFGFADGAGSKEYLLKSRADGTGDIEILAGGENVPGSTVSIIGRPVWSPDSRVICFAAGGYGPHKIMKISASGGSPSSMTSGSDDNALGWYQ